MAVGDQIDLRVSSPNRSDIEDFGNDLVSIFAEIKDDRATINVVQKLTPAVKIKIFEFIEKYRADIPQLNSIASFFRKVNENESFAFLPNLNLDQADLLKLHDSLRASNTGKSLDHLVDRAEDIYGDLLSKYYLGMAGTKRAFIGEGKKSKRVCRFCNKSQPETTFSKKAHAISEALGNKTLILNEECDACNNRFSRTIELDIINYLGLFRSFFNVKGKDGNKKFKGENFKIIPGENPEIQLTRGNRPEIDEHNYSLKLDSGQTLSHQNIYRCLSKFFLSIIHKDHLPAFGKTIEWINEEFTAGELPMILETISYETFSLQPKLTYYLRQVDDQSLPFAVGSFQFTCKLFVFIVPFSSKDDRDFTAEKDFQHFMKIFQHYDFSSEWSQQDFTSAKPKKYSLSLNFQMPKS